MASFNGHLVVSEDNPPVPGVKTTITLVIRNPTSDIITIAAGTYIYNDLSKSYTLTFDNPVIISGNGGSRTYDLEAGSVGPDANAIPGPIQMALVNPALGDGLTGEITSATQGKDNGYFFTSAKHVVEYGSMDEIASAGFPTTGYSYRAAQKHFSQNPHAKNISIGCKVASDASWIAALDAIKNENNDWYAVSCGARRMANQQEAAQWIQANEKIGILSTGDTQAVDAESGDIAAWAHLNNLDRVAVVYHPDAALADPLVDALNPADPCIEAALFGKMLAKDPGEATWMFKDVTSVPTYNLGTGQISTLKKKKANWYMTTASLPMLAEGTMASGEFIDIIRGIDWLKARIQTLVFMVLHQRDKVPYTNAGIQLIKATLDAALQEGVNRGLLAQYESYAPDKADIAEDYIGQRTLPDVTFTGELAGAIHHTIIKGRAVLKMSATEA
jgi:hypothetical protein